MSNNNILSKKNFGPNIKKLLEEKGITKEEFSYMIGVSTRIIYDYIDGFKTPGLENAIKIATALDVTLDSILRKM